MTEDEERKAFVEEALTWKGTPHVDNARVKGAGVDCATYIAEVSIARGLVPADIKIPAYSPQWHLHRNEEKYINELMKWTHEITKDEARAGDIAVWKFGRCFAHGAIIIDYPRIIHCVKGIGVHIDNAAQSSMLNWDMGKPRPVRFFSHWGR